ncbi:hypothetical protein MXD81_45060 [Microbacteriaceae bacterium K1510]|nr:hypothetical protein [Microbacteriaceae bacterium K1510]
MGLVLLATSAGAQDSLDQGKSGAQLFASNCAICHKSPEGLAKAGGVFGVQNFLREHYTASKETAAVIAAYLEAVDKAAGPAQRNAPPKRAVRGEGSGKPAAKKPESKSRDGSSASETKASGNKASESKPAEPKADAKPSESKPADAPKAEKSE